MERVLLNLLKDSGKDKDLIMKKSELIKMLQEIDGDPVVEISIDPNIKGQHGRRFFSELAGDYAPSDYDHDTRLHRKINILCDGLEDNGDTSDY